MAKDAGGHGSIKRSGPTYGIAKAVAEQLEAKVKEHSMKLQAIPKGKMGMVPDDIKATPAYRQLKSSFDSAFKDLQKHNTHFVKEYGKEMKADRASRRPRNT